MTALDPSSKFTIIRIWKYGKIFSQMSLCVRPEVSKSLVKIRNHNMLTAVMA